MLDIEIAGTAPRRHPAAIGVVLATGRRYAMLIEPLADWLARESDVSGAAAGARRRRLACGRAPREAALVLNQLLAGLTVYTDGSAEVQEALGTLYAAAAVTPSYQLRPLDLILSPAQRRLWPDVERRVVAELLPRRGRGAPDARILQETWYRTRLATAA